jgi:hypothetical protein
MIDDDQPAETEIVDAEVVDAEVVEAEVVDAEISSHAPAGEPDASVIPIEDAVEALPALARLAGGLWLRAAAWGVGTSVRMGTRLARAAADPATAADLYEDVADGLRGYAREFLGISDLDDRLRQLTPLAGATLSQNGTRPAEELRARGAELLRQAADVEFDEAAHPAYARILTELAPDEARILRLLSTEGPQPMVDVRAHNLIGIGSQLVAPSLNMLGAQAGLRRRDRVPGYLNNLLRLGLISLSDEPVDDPIAYQVLEAQPEVLGAIKDTTRAKAVHRRIELTPFGADFCRVCFGEEPLEQLEP